MKQATPALPDVNATRAESTNTTPYAECEACGWLTVADTIERARSAGVVHQLLAHSGARK